MGFASADIVIVGGGPIGLAAAIALRQAGADVLIADACEPPIDKACGEGLMPDSLCELSKLGIDLAQVAGTPFDGIRFADRQSTVSARFAEGQGLGVRRLALHRQLLDRAAAMGVRMRWKSLVELRHGEEPTLGGEVLRYKYLIGADGESSRTRAWAGLSAGGVRSRRFGFRAHFEFDRGDETGIYSGGRHVEVHWGDGGQAYVTPVGERMVCVAVISRSQSPGTFQSVIDSIPALRGSLARAKQLTPQRGAVTTTSSFDRVVRGRVALVGDALGTADAITGEGLAMGFRQALLLRDSIAEGGLKRYQAQHSDILRLPQGMARAMLLMDRHPLLRQRVLRGFARRPDLFAAMLSVHLNEESLSRVVLRHGVDFGRLLLSSAG
ncbi:MULTISPECIES: NAD(P)/FAD-dependent oxidoreductase [Acidobacteriaceae]|uniref:NAD(P)/FAD-dependent oxidoreductase n=1 Tax=Acidobacteriaceae TaxID=204434 RepID=UPI00131C922B|nr:MULTISPECIES: NAD(P)/FAD-dependent oxidoreductase [Acidobacteriaceae]MDW5266424.1 NAD(P)/FAD-dependent oxidoreductase [Edaphobacter sp.]